MNSKIEVKHGDYEITYSENEDVWRCWSMSLEAKTLSALRAKLNKETAKARRIDAPVVVISRYEGGIEAEGAATLIADGGRSVWVTNGRVRRKYDAPRVVMDTPEARELVADVSAEIKRLHVAIEAQRARLLSLPRPDLSLLPKEDRDE